MNGRSWKGSKELISLKTLQIKLWLAHFILQIPLLLVSCLFSWVTFWNSVCSNDCPIMQMRNPPFRRIILDTLNPVLISFFLRKSKNKWQKSLPRCLLSGSLGLFGFPRWLSGKESACQYKRCGGHGLNLGVRKIPWKRKWQSTPVFLPGKSHGLSSLVGSIGL